METQQTLDEAFDLIVLDHPQMTIGCRASSTSHRDKQLMSVWSPSKEGRLAHTPRAVHPGSTPQPPPLH